MTARIIAVRDRLEVEVTESENGMIGPFWVITPDETVYIGGDGARVGRAALRVGDLIRIRFGGQVMMSYPPQIVASEIRIIEDDLSPK